MKRIQWFFAYLTVVVALTVILDARQLWVAGTSSQTTSGTVSITNSGSSALAVTGGADIGGVIQAGSGNVNITNSTGNLLPAALASGTISTAQTLTGVATFQASTPHILIAPSGGSFAQLRGRSSDDDFILQFTNNAGNTETARFAVEDGIFSIGTGSSGTARFQIGPGGNAAFTEDVSIAGKIGSATEQPGFLAYNSVDDSIGAGTVTADFDQEVYDTTNSFSADTFTAPVTGTYEFHVAVSAASSQAIDILLVTSGAGTWHMARHVSSENRKYVASLVLPMTASSTASVSVVANTTASVLGDSGGIHYSWFSGRLVP